MRTLEEQGFYIDYTGGNCTAWVKELPTGQFLVVTCGGGCDHRYEKDAMVGLYDGKGDESMWGDFIYSFEIEFNEGEEE